MTRLIGTILTVMLTFGGSVAINAAAAAPLLSAVQEQPTAKAGDLGARRRLPHPDRYAYRGFDRPYYPTYYDRPLYYAPAPFFPFLGLGYGPWW